MRNPFKPTLAKRVKKFATSNHPTINNLAVGVVVVGAAAPVLRPVGAFFWAMGMNLIGHAENVVDSVGAKFTRRGRAANG